MTALLSRLDWWIAAETVVLLEGSPLSTLNRFLVSSLTKDLLLQSLSIDGWSVLESLERVLLRQSCPVCWIHPEWRKTFSYQRCLLLPVCWSHKHVTTNVEKVKRAVNTFWMHSVSPIQWKWCYSAKAQVQKQISHILTCFNWVCRSVTSVYIFIKTVKERSCSFPSSHCDYCHLKKCNALSQKQANRASQSTLCTRCLMY